MTVAELIAALQKMPPDVLFHPGIVNAIQRARLWLFDNENTANRECITTENRTWFAISREMVKDEKAMDAYCRFEHPGLSAAALKAAWGTYKFTPTAAGNP